MAILRRLTQWLTAAPHERITLRFDNLERITGPLPAAAWCSARWWSNDASARARTWLDAGYVVDLADVAGRTVTFRRLRSDEEFRRAS